MGARGGGRVSGWGAGGGAPPQPDVQPVRCIPPGIQKMPAHHTHHHHPNHAHLYNIDVTPENSSPPNPHDPSTSQPPPRTESGDGADGLRGGGGGGAGTGRHRGRRGSRREGQGRAWPWCRDWGTFLDPLGDEALPLVGDVYGLLSWANQGTTRGMTNRPFNAVLLRRDRGNRKVPPGGSAAPGDHERVLGSMIRAASPDRGPNWPAFLEEGAVLRITDVDTNNWLPRPLCNALTHLRYRRRSPPPP